MDRNRYEQGVQDGMKLQQYYVDLTGLDDLIMDTPDGDDKNFNRYIKSKLQKETGEFRSLMEEKAKGIFDECEFGGGI